MNDQDIRERASKELKQSFIVDAGAGTGKTTVLISRILGAVISGKSDLEHIVAITFTEKASGELKVRLRFELEEALRRLDGEEWSRVRRALAEIERAQVGTIHSFCAMLLRERPVEARIDPGFEVLDELGAHLLMERAWEEWVGIELERGPAIFEELLRGGMNLEEIQGVGKFLLDHRDLRHFFPSPVSEEMEEFLKLLKEDVEKLAGLEPSCKEPADRALAQIRHLQKGLEGLSAQGSRELREFLLSGLSLQTNAGNQKNWQPREELAEVKRLFGEIRNEQDRLASAIRHNQAAALLEWLAGYIEHYEQKKKARGYLDFFDLLFRCRELLKNNKQVRGYFQSRFDYILVDEFQDTDPLQIEILFFLAEKSPRAGDWQEAELKPGKLFLVGDPKQSIYRFRRADIEAYHGAREMMARQGEVLSLSLNFRSRPAVVDWINSLFSRLIQPPEEGAYQPLYQPIAPSRTAREGPSVLALPLAPQIPLDGGGAGSLRMAEARTVAAFLKKIVEQGLSVWDPRGRGKREITYGDVGILFRTKEAIDLYEEEFRDFEIPYRVAGGRRYYSRLEMNALLALLSCLDNPKDTVAFVAALRSPFFAASDEELFLSVREGHPLDFLLLDDQQDGLPESIREAGRCLRELYGSRNQLTVPLLLLRIFETTRILPLLYLKPQGDQKVANLLKLVDLARSLEERGLITLRSFVQFLKKMEATEAEEGESPLAEESEDAVRIMTIHKAKGLEFPLVILADVAYEGRHREGRGVIDRTQGRLEIRIGNQERGIMTQGWEKSRERERLREDAEDCRLLYVAATRARDYLVLPFPPQDERRRFLEPLWEGLRSEETVPWGREVFPFKDSELAVTVFDSRRLDAEKRELRPFRAVLSARHKEGARQKREPSLRRRRMWEKEQKEIRKKGSLGGKILAATEVARFRQAESWSSGPGQSFGSLVHDLFRAVDLSRPEEIRSAAQLLGRQYGVDNETIERAVQLVEWGLGSDILRRASRAPRHWKELPFVYRHGKDLIEGFIDLAFEEDGEIVVVDYKTDAVKNKSDLEERLLLYAPQGVLYGAALEKIAKKKVKEVIFLFLSAKQEKSIALGKGALRQAGRLLKEAHPPLGKLRDS